MYVYKQSEFSPYCLYTVGYFEPSGKWIPESDHPTSEEAAKRTALLNGSQLYDPTAYAEVVKLLKEYVEDYHSNHMGTPLDSSHFYHKANSLLEKIIIK